MHQLTNRQRRQQKTRQSILDAARRIVAEQGAQALSMRTLAERIEYSPSSIYEYFDSKEQIIQTICMEGHGLLTYAIRQVDETQPPAEYLLGIGLAYIDFAIANPDLYRIMFNDTPQVNDYSDLLTEGSSFVILLHAIRRGLESGVFIERPGYGLYEMAYAAWITVHGIASMRIYQPHFPPNFEQVRREALASFGRGLMNC